MGKRFEEVFPTLNLKKELDALYKDAECIDEFDILADAEIEFEKTVKENPDSEIDILSADGETTFLSYDPSSREIYRDQHRL